MEKKFYLPELNLELTLGKFAQQADGAAWLKQGGTIVLSTVVSATAKEFPGFLPLTVDYREQFSALGKIPGGYFKREGKLTDKEVLTSRFIDRAIRPLFPDQYFDSVQILATVYSIDKSYMPQTLSLLATSIALCISRIPFMEPVGAIEIGRIDGKWVINPTYVQTLASDVKIVVAGTKDGICMVEGTAQEISEDEFIEALFLAHEQIKKQVIWQEEICKEVAVEKSPLDTTLNWNQWFSYAEEVINQDSLKTLFVDDKAKRNEAIKALKNVFLKHCAEVAKKVEEEPVDAFLNYLFDEVLTKKLTEQIFVLHKRVDNRDFVTVRSISSEVGLLPFAHGSALFKRGRTQALVTATLGGGQDEVRTEDLMGGEAIDRNFMLHYNFPPFCVGEVKQQRGPGRREIGHGFLAQSAIKPILPRKVDFPYTMRIVADMLESDGSTSMATVCGSTLALMDAGVPITQMVSGVAMGLLQDKNGAFQVLTDISGIEDALGLMDFKVAGSETGITAIQMDIKHKEGLPRSLFVDALAQAKKARLHILQEMRKAMKAPRSHLSTLVPQIVSFKVSTSKIGSIIGPGGKIIREIIEKTGTTIDIEDDGTVKIFGSPGAQMDMAINWVKTLGGQIEAGMIYKGQIKRVADFGLFVEVAPGQDGLVHVSNIPRNLQQNFAKEFKVGDEVTVQVVDYDRTSDRIRLKIVEPATTA